MMEEFCIKKKLCNEFVFIRTYKLMAVVLSEQNLILSPSIILPISAVRKELRLLFRL